MVEASDDIRFFFPDSYEVTVTFDPWNLISSSSKFPRGRVERMCEVTVTLTFTLWPLGSNQFIHESKWTFQTNLKGSSGVVLELTRSQGKLKGLVRSWWQTANSNQRIFDFKWMFLPNLILFLRYSCYFQFFDVSPSSLFTFSLSVHLKVIKSKDKVFSTDFLTVFDL